MKVYVVGFAPADDRAAVGGFDWFYTHEHALKRMMRHLAQESDEGLHSYSYVPLEVPTPTVPRDTDEFRAQITDYIDSNLHLIEVNRGA